MKIYIEIFDRQKLEIQMKSGEFPFSTVITEGKRCQPDKTYILTSYATDWQLGRLTEIAKIIEIVEDSVEDYHAM